MANFYVALVLIQGLTGSQDSGNPPWLPNNLSASPTNANGYFPQWLHNTATLTCPSHHWQNRVPRCTTLSTDGVGRMLANAYFTAEVISMHNVAMDVIDIADDIMRRRRRAKFEQAVFSILLNSHNRHTSYFTLKIPHHRNSTPYFFRKCNRIGTPAKPKCCLN